MTSNYIIDRKLPERANLRFYFPNSSEGKRFFVVELPFFENPKIREQKRARLKKYNLISRSSNLYSYLGADSRQLSLEFNITLPHILDEHRDLRIDRFEVNVDNPVFEKEKFKSPVAAPPYSKNGSLAYVDRFFKNQSGLKDSANQVLSSDWARRGMTGSELNYLQETYGLNQTDDDAVKKAINAATGETVGADQTITTFDGAKSSQSQFSIGNDAFLNKMKVIDVVIYWINIIRSSVVNNAQNPIYGPPIIRLRHGVLYQDVPCICNDYSITVDERAGYDLQTLLPRKLQIKLKLEEFRTGDFGEFDQTTQIGKDNLAGWESVLTGPQTMDPGYIA
jgi:hypothetical protein